MSLSQLWIDFASVPGGLERFSKCLGYHTCYLTEQTNETFVQIQDLLNQTGDIPTFPSSYKEDHCACNTTTCSQYADCCADVEQEETHLPDHVPTVCISQDPGSSSPDFFYANVKCPSNFTDSTIRALCEAPIDKTTSKPDLEYWFVTSNTTLYTYRNIYCALCNGESMNNLEFWNVEISCESQTTTTPLPSPSPPPPLPPMSAPPFSSSSFPTPPFTPEPLLNTAKVPLSTKSPGDLATDYSSCHVFFRTTKSKVSCKQLDVITRCSLDYRGDQHISDQCEFGETARIRTLSEQWYKNIYCASCNGITDLSRLTCEPVYDPVGASTNIIILIHPFGKSCSKTSLFGRVEDGSCDPLSAAFSSCADDEIYSWTNQSCRSICPSPLQFVDGKCRVVDQSLLQTGNTTGLSTNCSYIPRNEYQQLQTGGGLSYRTDSIQLDVWNTSTSYCTRCKWIEYEQSDVTIEYSLRSLTTPDGTKYSSILYYIITNMSKVLVCGDPNATNTTDTEGLLGKICTRVEEGSVSITLMSISIVCLVIMIIVYSILPNLHNVPGYIVLSQVVPLLLGYIFFLLRDAADVDATGCYIVSVLVHYFFLSNNIWSFLYAVEITITVTSVYAINQKSKKKFLRYSIAGWSIPLIPVIAALVVDSTDHMSEFAPQYGQPECWFNSDYGLYLYFLIPIAIILLLNFITYIIIIVRFAVLAYQTRGVRTSHKEKLILSIKLFFAFGLLWTFGILGAIFPNNSAISCIFVFVNTLSGVLLMLVFICNKSVFSALKKHIKSHSSASTTGSGQAVSKPKGTESSHISDHPHHSTHDTTTQSTRI